MHKLQTLMTYPITILRTLAVLLTGAMAAVVGGSVVLRYIGFVPTGSSELATLLFLWAIYLGSFLAFLEGGHLAITALANRLRGRVLTAFVIVSDALLLTFLLIVSLESVTYVQLALNSIRVTPSLGISPAWMYSAVLVGMSLSTVYVGGSIVANLIRFKNGEEPPVMHDEVEIARPGGVQ